MWRAGPLTWNPVSYGYGAEYLKLDDSLMELLWLNRSVSLCLYSLLDIGIHDHGWDLGTVTKDTELIFGIASQDTCREIFQYIVGKSGELSEILSGISELYGFEKRSADGCRKVLPVKGISPIHSGTGTCTVSCFGKNICSWNINSKKRCRKNSLQRCSLFLRHFEISILSYPCRNQRIFSDSAMTSPVFSAALHPGPSSEPESFRHGISYGGYWPFLPFLSGI